MSVAHKLETIFWSAPPPDRKERKLLFKLDVVLLSFSCLAYFMLALDTANLSNAYVSGMREAVGFKGKDLSLAGSCWTAGYLVGQWPSAIALSSNRFPIRFWFTGCMFAWSICVLSLAFVHNVHQVWGIRFIQGVFEASVFSGFHYVYGSWYKAEELGARTAVFAASAQIGSLFSGILQGSIIRSLGGKNGLAGWQWLFILDFILTIPVALYGLAMFPDTPQSTTAFWLSADEKSLVVERLGRKTQVKMTLSILRASLLRIVTDWRWYLFSALFAISATSFEKTGVYSEFLLWLDSTGDYTVQQVNYLPCLFIATSIISTYALTLFSNYTGSRAIINPIMFVAVTTSATMLLVWDIGKAGHFFAYIIASLGYAGQATNFAWANTLCGDDDVLRAVTLYSMQVFSQLWALWYGITIWPVSTAPRFRNGQIATIVTGAVALGITGGIVYCSRHWPNGSSKHVEKDSDSEENSVSGREPLETPAESKDVVVAMGSAVPILAVV